MVVIQPALCSVFSPVLSLYIVFALGRCAGRFWVQSVVGVVIEQQQRAYYQCCGVQVARTIWYMDDVEHVQDNLTEHIRLLIGCGFGFFGFSDWFSLNATVLIDANTASSSYILSDGYVQVKLAAVSSEEKHTCVVEWQSLQYQISLSGETVQQQLPQPVMITDLDFCQPRRCEQICQWLSYRLATSLLHQQHRNLSLKVRQAEHLANSKPSEFFVV